MIGGQRVPALPTAQIPVLPANQRQPENSIYRFQAAFFTTIASQIELIHHIQIAVQLVHQRLPRGDFQHHDVGIGNALYIVNQIKKYPIKPL